MTDDALVTATAGGIVPVAVVPDVDQAAPLAAALAAGGLGTVEVTLRTDSAVDVIKRMSAEGALLVGAGTVLNERQVDAAVDAGARYVVTPGFSPSVVRHCRERGVPVLPGVSSATDLHAALDLDVRTVKFFPAKASGGVETVKALSAPFKDVSFVPTGGITAADVPTYLAVPSVLAVGGSWMVAKNLLAEGNMAEVTRLTKEALATAAASR